MALTSSYLSNAINRRAAGRSRDPHATTMNSLYLSEAVRRRAAPTRARTFVPSSHRTAIGRSILPMRRRAASMPPARTGPAHNDTPINKGVSSTTAASRRPCHEPAPHGPPEIRGLSDSPADRPRAPEARRMAQREDYRIAHHVRMHGFRRPTAGATRGIASRGTLRPHARRVRRTAHACRREFPIETGMADKQGLQ